MVLEKIDEILRWEKTKEREKDVRFVELGRYLCELRTGQYCRLENLKSFDDYLQKRFPDSRRKAYYLMAIHENLTQVPKHALCEVGWSKAIELAKVASVLHEIAKALACALSHLNIRLSPPLGKRLVE